MPDEEPPVPEDLPVDVDESPARGSPEEPTKRCSFCGEVILAVARKCKHCGELLDESLRAEAQQQPPAPLSAKKSPGVAALLSLVIPGAGQMYQEKVGRGFGWLVATILGYVCCVVPGVILHICCIFDAYTGKT